MAASTASKPLVGVEYLISELFRLRPPRAAKVSEISETTAAAPVPAEERINFHIGNPAQDPRLHAAFFRTVLGLSPSTTGDEDIVGTAQEDLGADEDQRPRLDFLLALIRKSAPYMPRGGYQRSAPNALIQSFAAWVEKGQPDPLSYDFGKTSGIREVILTSGGIAEAFRVFMLGTAQYLVHTPADLLLYGLSLPRHLLSLPHMRVATAEPDEAALLLRLRSLFERREQAPVFLGLGRIVNEETRWHLRQIALRHPLFMIEANDAPNSQSMARESRMSSRVLRFLTPAVFSPNLATLPTVFVAGSAAFVSMLEVAHFQLKGTPSAPEVEHLAALLEDAEKRKISNPTGLFDTIDDTSQYKRTAVVDRQTDASTRHLEALRRRVGESVAPHLASLAELATRLAAGREPLLDRARTILGTIVPGADPLAGHDTLDLLEEFFSSGCDALWQVRMETAFLTAFLGHHPEYVEADTQVVSGSSRTALGLMGFHCGIDEVVIPDLSWTYEHCFPTVTVVPLTDAYQLDVEGLDACVAAKISENPDWIHHGAVALNNPHNATGQAFSERDVKALLRCLLDRGVYVIDDLAYQHVAASDGLEGPGTIRQLSQELLREGYISSEQAERVITVQSVSKTDSLAGSRLAVVEIRDKALLARFQEVNATLRPNVAAMFLSYLFYRQSPERVVSYWTLRNRIFNERMNAIERAASSLPVERNRYDIAVRRPTGGMYPLLTIARLPNGLSLDWLASGLARQGIGLLPLSAFARTEKGFDSGRKAFRLTLGGVDGAEALFTKTRRVIIDLNRMIAEEESRYNRVSFPLRTIGRSRVLDLQSIRNQSSAFLQSVRELSKEGSSARRIPFLTKALRENGTDFQRMHDHINDRLGTFLQQAVERSEHTARLMERLVLGDSQTFAAQLEHELSKDTITRRTAVFRQRLFDRTVHPTQMCSIAVESVWSQAFSSIVRGESVCGKLAPRLASALCEEFAGINVPITSMDEGDELLLDLEAMLAAENVLLLDAEDPFVPFLSYWGDWDGSTRPSGQGHRLVATLLIQNIRAMGRLVSSLLHANQTAAISRAVVEQVRTLDARTLEFKKLLNEITTLTHQLERRYRGILPWKVATTAGRRAAMKLHLARDPVTRLWQHNDRLERRMLTLRQRRRNALMDYFAMNKAVRKALHDAIPAIVKNGRNSPLALEAVLYRDLLKRVAITPRIQQAMITSQDPFAIDTTVHNINEVNEIAGTFGNPAMILGLQVSMSTSPDALILLDRKLRANREEAHRRSQHGDISPVFLIPLFEDIDAVNGLSGYLTKIWEYALQSRRLGQETRERFMEMIPEIFVAGSDLSQQVGQTAGMSLFREAKHTLFSWLAERDLVGHVRMKLGSGEPMQRQGCYYAPQSGLPAFSISGSNGVRLAASLPAAAKKSVEYATTPLLGVFAASDLRTFQSNIAERLRSLPAAEYARLLHHVRTSQRSYERELTRAAEPLVDTRLQFASRGQQEIERLTVGKRDAVFDEFAKLSTENFRHIVYGRKEDVVGLHIISYFVARTSPPLRDRPTFRPGRNVAESQGQQIIERIAETIPLSKFGTLLRAIAHNQAQTAVLGVNQLTTGVFRTLHMFSGRQFQEGTGASLLAERILPHLPVYEILHTLRIYHDVEQTYVNKLERAFPAGNSSFTALREDLDVMETYLGLIRRELLRRHGLSVGSFFDGGTFQTQLLPALRPDLAVLLQPELFNTDAESLFSRIRGPIDEQWKNEVLRLLRIPRAISSLRKQIWDLLHKPVYARVQSFVELALALSTLADRVPSGTMPLSLARPPRPVPTMATGTGDDTMHQFLTAAFEYLTGLTQQNMEVPTSVVKALQDVERIIEIEELALSESEQEELRYYLLEIGRLAGENG